MVTAEQSGLEADPWLATMFGGEMELEATLDAEETKLSVVGVPVVTPRSAAAVFNFSLGYLRTGELM